MTSPADVHAAKLATIEAREDAPEALRERVAKALWVADNPAFADLFTVDQIDRMWERGSGFPEADKYRRFADVARDVLTMPIEGAPAGCGAEAALRRVLELADELELEQPMLRSGIRGGSRAADRIRAAVNGSEG